MKLKAILLITAVISLSATTSNFAAGQVEQLQNLTETNQLKSITNYDKVFRSIIDECSVKSMSAGNELTLLERIGCIDIIDKAIEKGMYN